MFTFSHVSQKFVPLTHSLTLMVCVCVCVCVVICRLLVVVVVVVIVLDPFHCEIVRFNAKWQCSKDDELTNNHHFFDVY